MLERISKHRETILFASCAVALVGSVVLLQKLTTPSKHHRRQAGSNASRGVPRSHSGHRGPPTAGNGGGERSRSSNRSRAFPASEKEGGASTTAGVTNPVKAAATGTAAAVGGVRGHNSRSRDLAHSHAHRHHPSHRQNANPTDANSTAAREAASTAPASKRPLTVEAMAQHKKALGTANALQRPDQSDIAGAVSVHRDAQTSGGGRTGSFFDDGPNHRSASNAATVGSQAVPGGPASVAALLAASATTAVAEAASAEEGRTGRPPRTPLPESMTTPSASLSALAARESASTVRAVHRQPDTLAVARATTDEKGEAAGKELQRRLTDHGTQTEYFVQERELHAQLLAAVTPDRWKQTGMPSPITAAEHEANNSTPLDCTGLGWTPVRETDHTRPMNTAAGTADVEAASPTLPLYFVAQLETQICALIRCVVDECESEGAWMRLYMYLSELPRSVRATLTKRGRCGASSSFVSLAITIAQELRHPLEKPAFAKREEISASSAAEPSLPLEVLHLLQQGTPKHADWHFERRDADHCVCVEGPFVARAAGRSDGGGIAVDEADGRSAQLAQERLSPSSSWLASEGESGEVRDDVDGSLSLVVAIAKHVDRYRYLERAGDGTPIRAPAEGKSDALSLDDAALNEALTPLRCKGNDEHLLADAVAAVKHLRTQQQQLNALLSAFLQLRHTEGFQTMRRTPASAPFACDFIELAAATQRCLESEAVTPNAPSILLKQLQAPSTQKRVLRSESTTDACDTSIGTVTSARSGSSPNIGTATQPRRRLPSRTPTKPSIRYPIQRVVSSASPPVGAAPATYKV